MAIRRQKINRRVDLPLKSGRVSDMPPDWVFTIKYQHHGTIIFDFNRFRANGRDDLAGHFRDAFWSMRHEYEGASMHDAKQKVRYFFRFLDDLHSNSEEITRLDQIDRTLIDKYLAWLALQITTIGKNKGNTLSTNARRKAFNTLTALLNNRKRRVPDAVNPDLTFPKNPFPNSNRLTPNREAYSTSEQKRIVEALNTDLRSIHEGQGEPLVPLQILLVHLLVLALSTGRNLQPLLDLRRNSLEVHPLPDRELLITMKRRGWSSHSTSIPTNPEASNDIQNIPTSIGDYFRFLCDYTAPLMKEVQEQDREYVFLWQIPKNNRKGQVVRLDESSVANAYRNFCRRHPSLLDDQGTPLKINISRMRPTFAVELYQRTNDIRRVAQALGHSSVRTTAKHYLGSPLEAERDHALVLEGMQSQFTRVEINGKVLLAADGEVPLQDVKDLLAGGYTTGIASCSNPFRKNGICKKFFRCFSCPSMCVFEDDLWRLYSFYFRLLHERNKINPAQWLQTYGPIVRRIDVDIARQFPSDKVEAARRKAQGTPHPAWKCESPL